MEHALRGAIRLRIGLVTLLLAPGMVGCVGPFGGSRINADHPLLADGTQPAATVYFIRERTFDGIAVNIPFYLDEPTDEGLPERADPPLAPWHLLVGFPETTEQLLRLRGGDCARVRILPGTYSLGIQEAGRYVEIDSADFVAGETYYVALRAVVPDLFNLEARTLVAFTDRETAEPILAEYDLISLDVGSENSSER